MVVSGNSSITIYEGVRTNVINVRKQWGIKFHQKRHYLTLAWPLILPDSLARHLLSEFSSVGMLRDIFYNRAGTNTPSDEYDTYREYRVANTNMYSRIHFFSEAKLGNGLSVLVYACTMYSAQKFHFANLVYYRYCLFDIQV